MANLLARLVGNVVDLVGMFTDVALADPLSAVLLTVGAVLTLCAVAVLGYLALGALVDAITPDVGSGPPPERRSTP